MSINDYIDNIVELDKTPVYAAIVGARPSQGSRSVVLWNKAFDTLHIDACMHPFDVEKKHFEAVMGALRDDTRYIGGAVTIPFKNDIVSQLDVLEDEAAVIGAVNCLYRDERGLVGGNTDGAGALSDIQERMHTPLEGQRVLLLGAGGAAQAVAVYISRALGQSGKLYIANRTKDRAEAIRKNVSPFTSAESIDYDAIDAVMPEITLLINGTSVGFEHMTHDAQGAFSLLSYCPLAPVPSLRVPNDDHAQEKYPREAASAIAKNVAISQKLLEKASDNLFVYDIIYQPTETTLLRLAKQRGLPCVNGLGMNRDQAVIAFEKATVAAGIRSPNINDIRIIMS